MKVLIIMGHPRKNSFSAAMAEVYKESAASIGAEVKQLNLIDYHFDPNVVTVSPRHQDHEEMVILAQQAMLWADHLVFVYPTWWGSMPALLKAFFDRTFTPGFAFEELEENHSWKKLLKGKTAHLITTMDTPLWVYRWIYKNPGANTIGTATLKFCGVGPIRTLSFSPIKYSSAEQRTQWLEKVRKEATKLRHGLLTPWEKILIRAQAWLKAIRLQFYPMTWIAYAAGAYAATGMDNDLSRPVFWLGYLWIFFLEVTTVLSNDYFDYESDKLNKYFSPFTGGSRVLLEKVLQPSQLRRGIVGAFILSIFAFIILAATLSIPNATLWALGLSMYILALGYTIPPLKLSYRGLGELDVGVTHSFGVILCGFIFQGGNISDPLPWLVGFPLFLAIFPSIILAGVPDYDADKAVGKRTIAVRLGRKNAVRIAIVFTILSATAAAVLSWFGLAAGIYNWTILFIISHAMFLIYRLSHYLGDRSPSPLINDLMINALTYVIWFGVIPVLQLK